MALNIGTKAPDFTLKTKTADGLKDVKLSDHFGKQNVVLLFVPLAFTGICTQELCDVSGGLGDFEGLNATVYGISVDSPFAQEAWAKQAGIKMTLLSDFGRTVSTAYDVLFADLIGLPGVAKRSAFVINKEGVIVHSFSSDDPKKIPDFAAVKAALKA